MIAPLLLLAASSLSLRTVTGTTERLYPTNDRKATVVFVVLAECPIARKFSPEIARIARDYGRRGVRFVMAFADGTPASIKAQMKSFELPFPAAKADAGLIKLLKAATVPTAAIVAPSGKLPYVGRIDDRFPTLGVQRKPRRADLRIALDQFLAGKPVSPARTEVIGCGLPTP
ncbi:redoxin domain-containing protein [bacterium]|nr:MAG: redoxin domain-containing protein [bacterium]